MGAISFLEPHNQEHVLTKQSNDRKKKIRLLKDNNQAKSVHYFLILKQLKSCSLKELATATAVPKTHAAQFCFSMKLHCCCFVPRTNRTGASLEVKALQMFLRD